MTIEQDVQHVAEYFGEDPRLLQAIVNAEGNILRAVQCSVPSCQTRDRALQITCRTINHARRDYLAQHGQNADFVAFLSKRWAPPGAANDPTHLNENWPNNVRKLWGVA
jgi:hypothetical protein